MALLAWDFYDSLLETLDIMGDEELMAGLRQSAREVEAGELIPLEDVEKLLDEQDVREDA